jgi:hypothetical protein
MANEKSEELGGVVEPGISELLGTLGIALGFVASTRPPFVRGGPVETDEFGFVAQMDAGWLPMHHTLFQTLGRAIGLLVGGHYQGLIVLDILVSAFALVSLSWWLRALVRPATSAALTPLIGVAPLFWSLGEMAANFTMIPLVGSFSLGLAYRGWHAPRAWHSVLSGRHPPPRLAGRFRPRGRAFLEGRSPQEPGRTVQHDLADEEFVAGSEQVSKRSQ